MLEKNSDAWHAKKRYIEDEKGEKNEESDMSTWMCQKYRYAKIFVTKSVSLSSDESWMPNERICVLKEYPSQRQYIRIVHIIASV